MKIKYISVVLIIILGLFSCFYYFPITHPQKYNYLGKTRSEVIRVLFERSSPVEIYFSSNYRKFDTIKDMESCTELMSAFKWEIDSYKKNGKIFSHILFFKNNHVISQETSRRRDGP